MVGRRGDGSVQLHGVVGHLVVGDDRGDVLLGLLLQMCPVGGQGQFVGMQPPHLGIRGLHPDAGGTARAAIEFLLAQQAHAAEEGHGDGG